LKQRGQVVGAVKEVTRRGVRFADGREEQFDAIILATGYRSNVPSWLKVNKILSSFLPSLPSTANEAAEVKRGDATETDLPVRWFGPLPQARARRPLFCSAILSLCRSRVCRLVLARSFLPN
jgi:hypothetical protein